MATFAVSILDGTTYDVTISAGIVTITDHSNYDTNTDAGHAQADFSDYKKIYVTDPNGAEYVFSSLGDGDELIDTPAVATLPIATVYTSNGDGVYTMYLEAVPTWDAAETYTLTDTHHVYYNGKLYKSLQNGNTNKNPVTQIAWWEEVDAEDLPAKYRLEYKFAVTCALQICFQQACYTAVCAIEDLNCSDCVCSDANFIKAVKLDIILEHIQTLVDNGDWDRVTTVINLGSQLCSCSQSTNGCNC